VNLTAPSPVRNAEFVKALGRVLKRPAVVPVPSFAPKLLLGSELARALLLEGQRVMPNALTRDGFAFDHTDVESALRAELGR
jgi:NAD dependent epimerase/dehydratase family enzyme